MREIKSIKVLIVDDSAADSFLICEFLDDIIEVSYTYYHCETFAQAKETISNQSFDIVLLDLHLPDTHGIKHIQEFSKQNGHIPLIILTGMTDKDIALNALKNGVDDYLMKGEFDAKLLQRSIVYAMERKRMEEESISQILAAQDKEKERIARDVHDSLGQNLTSAVLHLHNLKEHLKSSNEEINDSIDISIKCINEAITESRGISRSLMPKTVQKFGLVSGIEGMLQMYGEAGKIKLEFESNLESERFDDAIELAYFRIAQEAFNNVLKYANAKKVQVSLHQFKNNLVLIIADDGKGFILDDVENQKGIGLNSMRVRARSISAELSIDSSKSCGTLLRLSLILNDNNNKNLNTSLN